MSKQSWIRKDTSLIRHKKIRKLMELLLIPRLYACGIVTELYSWAKHHAPDGNLSDIDVEDMCHDIYYTDNAGNLIDALVQAGFLDRDGDSLTIHKWLDRNGTTEDEREKSRESSQRYRDRKVEDVDNPVDNSRDSCVTETQLSRESHADVTKSRDLSRDERDDTGHDLTLTGQDKTLTGADAREEARSISPEEKRNTHTPKSPKLCVTCGKGLHVHAAYPNCYDCRKAKEGAVPA